MRMQAGFNLLALVVDSLLISKRLPSKCTQLTAKCAGFLKLLLHGHVW